jgi:hypothetical protein
MLDAESWFRDEAGTAFAGILNDPERRFAALSRALSGKSA